MVAPHVVEPAARLRQEIMLAEVSRERRLALAGSGAASASHRPGKRSPLQTAKRTAAAAGSLLAALAAGVASLLMEGHAVSALGLWHAGSDGLRGRQPAHGE